MKDVSSSSVLSSVSTAEEHIEQTVDQKKYDTPINHMSKKNKNASIENTFSNLTLSDSKSKQPKKDKCSKCNCDNNYNETMTKLNLISEILENLTKNKEKSIPVSKIEKKEKTFADIYEMELKKIQDDKKKEIKLSIIKDCYSQSKE